MAVAQGITTSKQFFLWDYESSLFPLHTNRLLVEKYSSEVLDFIQKERLTSDGGFQGQHRVFATKRGWFLRPTVKLDPIAEFFFYDFVYRNRRLFRKSPRDDRKIYGFRIVSGEPIPILSWSAGSSQGTAQSVAEVFPEVFTDESAAGGIRGDCILDRRVPLIVLPVFDNP
jgi:hypothetical protein